MKNSYDYKGMALMKGSRAYELFELSKKPGDDGKVAKKQFEQHMKDVHSKAKELLERYGNS
jgi:hypothetical protein